jgi:hypothetical protein
VHGWRGHYDDRDRRDEGCGIVGDYCDNRHNSQRGKKGREKERKKDILPRKVIEDRLGTLTGPRSVFRLLGGRNYQVLQLGSKISKSGDGESETLLLRYSSAGQLGKRGC